MDGVRMDDLGGGNDVRDVEVAVRRGRRADTHRLVGQAHVHRVGIGSRVHRDRLYPHLMAGAVNAECDLATVGDQQFLNWYRHSALADDDEWLIELDRLAV